MGLTCVKERDREAVCKCSQTSIGFAIIAPLFLIS